MTYFVVYGTRNAVAYTNALTNVTVSPTTSGPWNVNVYAYNATYGLLARGYVIVGLIVESMILRFDASNPLSYSATGSTLTQLKDMSGKGNNTNAVRATAPTIGTTTLNTMPAFKLTGGGFSGLFATTYSGSTFSFYMVMSYTGGANNGRWLSFSSGADDYGGTYAFMIDTTGTTYPSITRNNPTKVGPATTIVQSTPTIVSGYFDGTNMYIGLNGGNGTAGTTTYSSLASTGVFTLSQYGIGVYSNTGSTSYVDTMNLGEVIVYTSSPSLAERQSIEGYLATKWHLQNKLATTHPFYNASN